MIIPLFKLLFPFSSIVEYKVTVICVKHSTVVIKIHSGSIPRGMHVSPVKHSYAWLPRKVTTGQTDARQSDPYMPLCIAGDTTSELVCVPVNSWIRYIFLLHMPSTRDKWYSYLHCKLEPQPFGLQGYALLTKLDLLWRIIKWYWMNRLGFKRFCYKLHIWSKFLQFNHFFVAGCLLSCVASYMYTFLYWQIIIYQLRWV